MSEHVADIWGTLQEQRQRDFPMLGWLDSPLIQRNYVFPQIANQQDGNWLVWLADQLNIPRDTRWLSIGCGAGGLERNAMAEGLCAEIHGVDIAPGAIELAQRLADEQGLEHIHYEVLNVERTRLPAQHYDVVLCGMALHHIKRLEYFYEEVIQSLRPGGFILLNEFVGPNQWQWTDTQLTAINTILAALPESYRVIATTGEIKHAEERPTLRYMNLFDPSESIRSAELMDLLGRQFQIVLQRDYGGALLGKLLEYIVSNFDGSSQADVTLLRLLCGFEQAMMKIGAIGSDFTVAAAQNGSSLRQSVLPLDAELERHEVYGFFPPEYTPEGQLYYWTAPETAFVLNRPANARSLRLTLGLPPVPRKLTIEVDGVAIGALRSSKTSTISGPYTVEFSLPAQTRSQPTITLRLDQGWFPRDLFQVIDDRELGVPLFHAEFR